MKLRLFRRERVEVRKPRAGQRYVSGLQKDVHKYQGWKREEVESDYRASKSVHTILTLGYLEYSDDLLVLTERGESLMQNVKDCMPGNADPDRS